MLRPLLFSVHLLILSGCRIDHEQSAPDSLVANNKSQGNVALIMTGSDEAGRDENALRIWQSLSDKRMGFQVVDKFEDLPRTRVLDLTKKYAAFVGSYGTFLWYFNSHGSKSGCIYLGAMKNDKVSVDEILDAMTMLRKTKLKRLILIIDTCYSGMAVNRIIPRPFFESALFLSSTQDNATSKRTALSTALAKVVSSTENEITVGQFLAEIQRNIPGRQEIYFKTFPDQKMLSEPLFIKP